MAIDDTYLERLIMDARNGAREAHDEGRHRYGARLESCADALEEIRPELRRLLARETWPHHSSIAPPGLQGVLVLFVWIGALDRAARIEKMPTAEQPHARRGLAQWLWLNGVRGEACWMWGQG